MSAETEFEIARITLRFDHDEDRISLAAADAGGAERVLWLTRRLLARLLPVLREWLEAGSAVAARSLPEWRDSVLAMEHAAIVTNAAMHDSAAAVRGAADGILVTRIDLQRRDAQVRLNFMDATRTFACLGLDRTGLHRFAGALARQMQLAEWVKPEDLAWLGAEAQEDLSAAAKPFTLN